MNVQIMGGPRDGFMVEDQPEGATTVPVDWYDNHEGHLHHRVVELQVHRPFSPLNDEAYAIWPGYKLL
jgi:hypothetical protein